MQSSYKGYFLEEEDSTVYVYYSVDDWRDRSPIHQAMSEDSAKAWIDEQIAQSKHAEFTALDVETKAINIRGMDPYLYRAARIRALKEHKNIGEWINEAIKEKLAR